MHNFRIVLTAPGRGEVWMDGEKVQHVTSVEVRAAVNEINTVKLTFNAGNVEVEGPLELVDNDA